MTALFLYGTLRHLPHLEVVAGGLEGLTISDAALPDHSVRAMGPLMIPVLVEEFGASAPGIMVEGLTADQRARLDFYEDGYGYRTENRTLQGGRTADVFIPPANSDRPDAIWTLDAWQPRFAELITMAAREVMLYHGRLSPTEVAARMPSIRARAGARMRAAHSHHGPGTLGGTVHIDRHERAYVDFYALDEFTLRHETFSGAMTEPLDRAVFIANDASIVLPYDPVRDRVLLVEQIRLGPLGRGDQALWQLEPIAGRVDGGETPEDCAHRETREEAGLELRELIPIAQTYASPGNATEFHYIYLGLAELPDDAAGLGGAADEGEDIKAHILSFDRLMDMTRSFEAANAPLVLAALWLAGQRDHLRGLR
ncbi:MAG: NUDIX domain-containing protein [Pseudomonadota bacterium]